MVLVHKSAAIIIVAPGKIVLIVQRIAVLVFALILRIRPIAKIIAVFGIGIVILVLLLALIILTSMNVIMTQRIAFGIIIIIFAVVAVRVADNMVISMTAKQTAVFGILIITPVIN